MNRPLDQNITGMTYSTLNIPTNLFSNSQFHTVPHGLDLNTNQTILFKSENSTRQKQKDEEFINDFIKSRSIKKIIEKCPSTLKIFEAKNYLRDVIQLKVELEICSKTLSVNDNDFHSKWEEIVVKQNKINDLLIAFDRNLLDSLKTALAKRRKKRNWEKRKKLRQRDMKNVSEENVRVKHGLIDKLLSEKSKEVESVKRTEALRRQADSVLHEVRRKKYEAKKMRNMLSALSKLRELRIQQEVAQGGYCSKEITETFNNVINQFQGLWEKQSEIYNLEEKGLKVMLEESEIPQVKISNFQKILNQWEQAFFGMPSSGDSHTFLTLPEEDINSFIFIRRNWDQYITNHSTVLSSCMPVGWVSPNETDNEEWKAFLKSKKSKKF